MVIVDHKKNSAPDIKKDIQRLKRQVLWLTVLVGLLIGLTIRLFFKCDRLTETLALVTENIRLISEFSRLVLSKFEQIDKLLEFLEEFALGLH